MAKYVNDIYGIINSKGKKEITLQKICDIIDVPVPEELMDIKDVVQNNVSTRMQDAKEGCFFFRITNIGSKKNPLKKWLPRVEKKKCTAVFVDRKQYENENLQESGLPLIPVDNIIEKTGKFFAYMKDLNGVKTYSVTGTCGKTTTMRFLSSIIPNHFNTWVNEGNANSYMSVSRHIMEELSPRNEVYLQEVGAASPNSIRKSACMLEVDAFVLLNIFNHHINEYKTQEAILKDKTSFDDYMKDDGVVVANYDDELIAGHQFKHRVISFGINTERNVDVRAKNVVQHGEVLDLDIEFEGRTVHIATSILGVQNAYNVAAAFALCRHIGIKVEDIVKGFNNYKSTGFRQRFWNLGGYNLLIDAYNICEDSLKANLKTVSEMEVAEGNKKIAVITGENKLGADAYDISFKLGQELELDELDHVIVVGPAVESQKNIDYYCHGRALYEGITAGGYKNAVYVTNPSDMETEIRKVISEGDLILFKGMYNMDLTPVIDNIFGSKLAMNNPYYIKQAEEIETRDYVGMKFPVINGVEICDVKNNKTNVVIPDQLEGFPVFSIKNSIFRMSPRIKSIDFGKSIKNIARYAFAGCVRLKKVTIPSNVKVIEPGAFAFCLGLREVVIEEGVTQIEENAFKGCVMLSKVVIPDSVKFIDPTAFDNCIFMKRKV